MDDEGVKIFLRARASISLIIQQYTSIWGACFT
jgi:hypothetical protein